MLLMTYLAGFLHISCSSHSRSVLLIATCGCVDVFKSNDLDRDLVGFDVTSSGQGPPLP